MGSSGRCVTGVGSDVILGQGYEEWSKGARGSNWAPGTRWDGQELKTNFDGFERMLNILRSK